MSAGHDLQAAIVAALRADAALSTLTGGEARILDVVPPEQAFPYVAIGKTTTQDWSTDDRPGEDHIVTLRCWSRATSRDEALAMADRASAALEGIEGVHGATRIVSFRPVSSDHGYEPADRAWRAVLRFRALSEPAA